MKRNATDRAGSIVGVPGVDGCEGAQKFVPWFAPLGDQWTVGKLLLTEVVVKLLIDSFLLEVLLENKPEANHPGTQ